MVFSSVTFLFYFLPVFLFLYFLTPFKNTVLLVGSLLFYAWGEAGYTLLLLLSILLNYIFGLSVASNSSLKSRKMYLGIGILVNLLLLGYYKYFNFIAESILDLNQSESVHLPLGISFFTFQAISYLVDVYRKDAKVEKNIFNLALYISMFPQLIAGPIVRFKTVAIQINKRTSTIDNIVIGIRIFIIGLAQKALIANTVAIPADEIFSLSENILTTPLAWIGALTYSFQIYFDFAGYSNMAIGLGLIMGFSFPKNFNYPYISQSITEFWRRWHISLSSWFRDYLYIPLGGNRHSPFRTYLNLMLVFLLCGLWHGAAWTFIIWGAYHGAFLMLERYKLTFYLTKLWRPVRHLYTLIVVLIGWIIFRAESFDQLRYYLKAFIGLTNANADLFNMNGLLTNTLKISILFGLIFSSPIYVFIQQLLDHKQPGRPVKVKFTLKVLIELFVFSIFILSLLNVSSGSYNPFIYFRF